MDRSQVLVTLITVWFSQSSLSDSIPLCHSPSINIYKLSYCFMLHCTLLSCRWIGPIHPMGSCLNVPICRYVPVLCWLPRIPSTEHAKSWSSCQKHHGWCWWEFTCHICQRLSAAQVSISENKCKKTMNWENELAWFMVEDEAGGGV